MQLVPHILVYREHATYPDIHLSTNGVLAENTNLKKLQSAALGCLAHTTTAALQVRAGTGTPGYLFVSVFTSKSICRVRSGTYECCSSSQLDPRHQ